MQPHARRVLVSEIDVVGATKKLRLTDQSSLSSSPPASSPLLPGATAAPSAAGRRGVSLPRSVAPPGTRLVARFRVDNWVVARFALDRPQRVSVDSLTRRAPKFFRQTPAALLVFMQRRGTLTPELTPGRAGADAASA